MLVFQLLVQGCSNMKSIVILATALFLASAPSPDSKTISELSAGFLKPSDSQPLLAADLEQASARTDVSAPTKPVINP